MTLSGDGQYILHDKRRFDSLIPKQERFDCSVFLMLLIKMLLTFVIDECEMFAAALMFLLADHTNDRED